MRFPGLNAAPRAVPAALVAAVLLAAPAALAQTAEEAEAKKDTDVCSDTLKKEYGVTEVGDINHKNTKHRNSVYLDATLSDGQTVRFRCMFNERSAPQVQAYAAPDAVGAVAGKQWGSADAYKVPPSEEPAQAKTEPEAAAPGKPPVPEGTTPESKKPDDGKAEGEGEKAEAPPAEGEGEGEPAPTGPVFKPVPSGS